MILYTTDNTILIPVGYDTA